MKFHWFGKTVSERIEYGRKEEFANVFECERVGLQRLALLLTANSEIARLCLIRSFRECLASNSVSKEWILGWTRRVIIRNAISLVMDSRYHSFASTNEDGNEGLIAFPQDDLLGEIAGSESVLDLPAFDRFVFVICALEGYSMYDCALLLGKTPRDIDEARQRVSNQVGPIIELGDKSHVA